MSKSEQVNIIDYPLLITMAGVGLLLSMACLMFGVAFDFWEMAMVLAAICLVITALTIGLFLYFGHKKKNAAFDSLSVTKVMQPQVITSLDGQLVYCNAPYRVFMKEGLCREDVVSPLELMEEDQVKAINERLSVLERKSEETHIVQLVAGDGKKRYAEVILCRKSGQEGYVSWVFSGTTSEVPGEIERHHEQGFALEQLGSLLDRSDCGLIAISDTGQIIYMNDILLHWVTGQSGEKMTFPLPLTEFCSIEAHHLNGRIEVNTLSDNTLLLDFLPVNRTLLDHGNLNNSGQAPEQMSQQTVTTVCQVFALQEDGHTAALSTEKVNIDRFFRESPIGIAIVTAQGKVLERNRVFREYVQELDINNSRSLKHIIDVEEYPDFYDRLFTTLETGQASSISDIGFKGTGEKHGHIYITQLENFADRDKVAILYLIDTTEQKNLELQFAQSQKMQAVGQLAGGVAHDFNNLLTAIIGFSDLLLVRHGPGDQSFSDVIQIKQNANRAANLVRQLLAFSRQQTLRPKILNITDVLAELSNLLGRLIGDNIELEMTHGRDLGQVKVDQGQMEQVIINLCVNARDAMDNRGKISIRTRNISLAESKILSERYQVMPENEYVLLEVEDTGCGIAKEHMGKIFEPFFSTKEVGKGTGLGLSTVYGIVKQTDGFIFPTSELDKGTTFSIYLPVHHEVHKVENTEEIDRKDKEKEAVDLTGKGTILLVEDEDAVRMFASRALKNKGYHVYEANSGEAAIKLFEEIEDELDLLISDVVMPIMDGPTLVRKIRETNSKLKVIFISGYAEDAFDKTPGEDDFHFLPKPFSLKQLAERVKEILVTG